MSQTNPPPPSWVGTPKEYKWRAMDSNGKWYFYQNEPEKLDDCFVNNEEDDLDPRDAYYENWEDTLQMRVQEEEI